MRLNFGFVVTSVISGTVGNVRVCNLRPVWTLPFARGVSNSDHHIYIYVIILGCNIVCASLSAMKYAKRTSILVERKKFRKLKLSNPPCSSRWT